MSEKPRLWFKGPEPKKVQLLKKNEYPSDLVIGGVCKPAGTSEVSRGRAAKAVEKGFLDRVKSLKGRFGFGKPDLEGNFGRVLEEAPRSEPMGVEAALPPNYRVDPRNKA